MRMLIKSHLYITFIIVIAAIVRLIAITSNPPALNWDEISHGYNAYSILQTGKDEWGETFPSIFRAYGDYKLPVYIYTTVLSVASFGLNEFAVRLPSVVAGTVTVFFTYLLTLELLKNRTNKKQIALWSALLVAFEPWTFFISRGAFEANLALSLIILGVYFFLRGLQYPKQFIVSALCFGLSVWTYNSARVFVPLFVFCLVILYFRQLRKLIQLNKFVAIVSTIVLILFFVPMFYQLLVPVGQARYSKVAILDEGSIHQIEEARNNANLPPILNRLVNNRYMYFATQAGTNWMSHYTPDFLFLKGGTQYQFSTPNHGLLYLFTLPFLSLGLIQLIKLRTKESTLLLLWLILGPLASSITREAPHVLRSVTLLPVPMILTGIGIVYFVQWMLSKKFSVSFSPLLVPTIIAFLVLSFVQYWIAYSTDYKTNYSWSWQYGYKEVVDYTQKHYENYDYIITTKKYGEPHEFFLFYLKWNPEAFRNDDQLIRYAQSDWFWVDRFDKYWFVNDWQIQDRESDVKFITENGTIINCANIKCLLITSQDTVPQSWNKISAIYFLDGKIAFELYEN